MCQALRPLAVLAAHSTREHGESGAFTARAVVVSPYVAHLAWSCDCLECAAWEAHLSWGLHVHV